MIQDSGRNEDPSADGALVDRRRPAATARQGEAGVRDPIGAPRREGITLHVRREGDGAPVDGALVEDADRSPMETEVIAAGELRVIAKAGQSQVGAELRVSAPGYLPELYTLRRDEFEATIHLEEARQLVLQVVDAVSGAPHPNMQVRGRFSLEGKEEYLDPCVTGEKGRVTLHIRSGPGQLRLSIRGQGVFGITLDLDLSANLPNPVRIAIGGLGTIQGRVLGLEGREESKPPWVEVLAVFEHDWDTWNQRGVAFLSADGSFRIEGLPLGLPLGLRAVSRAGDWEASASEPVVLTQQVPVADVTLVAHNNEDSPVLVVWLVDERGEVFQPDHFWVSALTKGPPGIADPWNWGEDRVRGFENWDAQNFVLELTQPDTYRIVVRLDDWVVAEATAEWPKEREITVTVAPETGLSIRVTRDGRAVGSAEVSTHRADFEPMGLFWDDWRQQGITGANGLLVIQGLPKNQGFRLLVDDGGYDNFLVEGVFTGEASVEVELPDRVQIVARIPGVPRGSRIVYAVVRGGDWNEGDLELDLEDRVEVTLNPSGEARDLWIGLPNKKWVLRELPPCSAGDHIDLGELQPQDGVEFKGHVVDKRGEPVAGASIWIISPLWGMGYQFEEETDAMGWFRFDVVPSRGVDLYISTDDGRYYNELPCRINESARTFVFPRQATLRVEVNADHVGSVLSLARNGGAFPADLASINIQKEEAVERHLSAGTWKVWLRSPPQKEWIDLGEVNLQPGETLTLALP